jgi:methionyl-tRNA synthetase
MSRRVLVTSTPPTPNGDLHVGHLAGPYLGADVFRRYRLAQGDRVSHITSTDDHQTYLERKAEVRGEDPSETASFFAAQIRRTLSLARIEVDAFTSPATSPAHDAFVGGLFTRLVDRGVIVPRDTPAFRCEPCDRVLVDYDCTGRCGTCGEPCDVGICEECGHPSSPLTLVDPRCTRCGGEPTLITLTRLTIDLEEHRAALAAYHAIPRSRPHTRALWEQLAAQRLPVVAMAHPGSWGIPCAVPGFEAHRWWGMAEMGPGYVATTGSLGEDVWHDPEAEIIQFFGFDNSYWQTVLHPALFLADGLRPADHFVVNEFYLLDGAKFSSSKNHAVWGPDILAKVPADLLRYYACLTGPEERQTNFTLAEFAATVNADLAGAATRAVDTLRVAAAAANTHDTGDALAKRATMAAEAMAGCFEPSTFSLSGAVRTWHDALLQLAAAAPGAPAPDAASALSIMARAVAPVMPDAADRMQHAAASDEPLFAEVTW